MSVCGVPLYGPVGFSSMKISTAASFAATLIGLIAVACFASAQDITDPFDSWSRATEGAAGGIDNPDALPGFQTSGNDEILRHRDFTGKPCLTVSGSARPEAIDPDMYDDVITAQNVCPQHIAIQVCYFQSQECIPMDVPGGERKEAILGSLPATQDFQFEFREKF